MIWCLRHQQEEFKCQLLKYSMRGLLQHWTESSIILTSEEESVWRNKRPRSRTVSCAEDRLLTWSMSTSGSQEPTILSRIMPTYSLLVFEMMIFRNSIQSGMKFSCQWSNSHLIDILESLYKLRIRDVWETQDRIEIVWPGDPSEENRTWLITEWKRWWKEESSRVYELVIFKPEMEIMRETPWSRIQVTKQRVQRILGDCWQWESNGQCSRGDNCSFRHDINKRGKMTPVKYVSEILSCNRMTEKHREPEVPEEKVPVVECLDGACKDYLKGTCNNSFCKSGTLQNACSTRPRVVVGFGKSAHTHTVRLMNSRLKGLKRMMTRVQ